MRQHLKEAFGLLRPIFAVARRPRRFLLSRRLPLAGLLLAVLLLAAAIFGGINIPSAQAQGTNGAITGLTVTSEAPDTLTLRWNAPSPTPSNYRVDWAKTLAYYPSAGTGRTYNIGHAYPEGTATEVTLTNLKVGAYYKVRMRARYNQGPSDGDPWSGPWARSEVQKVRGQNPSDGLIAAVRLTRSGGDLTISWDAPVQPSHQPPTDYRVSWSEDGSDYVSASDDTGNAYPTGTTQIVSGITDGTQYKARVRARYTDGYTHHPWSGPWVEAVTTEGGGYESVAQQPISGTGTVTLSYEDPWAGITLIAGLEDPHGIGEPSWVWLRSPDGSSDFEDVSGTVIHGNNGTTSYLPTVDDVGYYLRATVSYTNRNGIQSAHAVTTAGVVAKPACSSPADVPSAVLGGGFQPQDAWSDGRTLWVATKTHYVVRPFNLCSGARLPGDRVAYLENLVHQNMGRVEVKAMWAEGPTMWVNADENRYRRALRAYSMHPSRGWIIDYNRTYRVDPCGLWYGAIYGSEGILYVTPYGFHPLESHVVFAYDWLNQPTTRQERINGQTLWRSTGRQAVKGAFKRSDWGDESNPYLEPTGITSDGSHVWLAQDRAKTLKAFSVPLESGRLTRASAKDITLGSELDQVGGMWTDGERVWVTSRSADRSRNGVFVYPIPENPAQEAKSNPNNPATGAPGISGAPAVGETLTATTSGISDDDGLSKAVFAYQWIRHDPADSTDAEIEGATGSTYTMVGADVGKALQVRVTFTDDAGNEESLTSNGIAPALTVESAAVDGATLTLTFSEVLDELVSLPVSAFTVNVNVQDRTVSAVSVSGSEITLTLASAVSSEETVTVDYAKPDGPDFIRDTLGNVGDSFTGQAVTNNTVFSEPEKQAAPLTAIVHSVPESHDGQGEFTFELRFSEEVPIRYLTLRDHAFTVTGGSVSKAGRLEPPGNIRWAITVRPESDDAVAIVLPVSGNCEADGAICTEDGRPLSSRLELTVAGSSPQEQAVNAPATGAPGITGTARVGETLTADASDIEDPDGMDDAAFTFRWTAGGNDIAGATAASYILTADEEGLAITVRVSFTDDAGNPESLTSAATEAVAATAAPDCRVPGRACLP